MVRCMYIWFTTELEIILINPLIIWQFDFYAKYIIHNYLLGTAINELICVL